MKGLWQISGLNLFFSLKFEKKSLGLRLGAMLGLSSNEEIQQEEGNLNEGREAFNFFFNFKGSSFFFSDLLVISVDLKHWLELKAKSFTSTRYLTRPDKVLVLHCYLTSWMNFSGLNSLEPLKETQLTQTNQRNQKFINAWLGSF